MPLPLADNEYHARHDEHTFLAMARFGSHTIAGKARECGDCHASDALGEYLSTGSVRVTRWHEWEHRIEYQSGIIPVPPDWHTALEFDFVDLDNEGNWIFMETGPDAFQMLFGTPLSDAQIER